MPCPPHNAEWPADWEIPERQWLVFPSMSAAWKKLKILKERSTWPKEKFAFVDTKIGRIYSPTRHTAKELSDLGNGGIHNKEVTWEAYILSNTSSFGWNSVRAPLYHKAGALNAIEWLAYAILLEHYPLD